MTNDLNPTPILFKGVMVSSTFTDLQQHRAALIQIIKKHGLIEIAMENDSAKPDVDVVESSLQMVADASAYICVISLKYGQTPVCAMRNPQQLSITELEFNEAQRLGRPILLFIMGDDHPTKKADVETDPVKLEKLNAFRERAKPMHSDSAVHRVYATFQDLEQFKDQAHNSLAKLDGCLKQQPKPQLTANAINADPIPIAPAFYAEPAYLGSHEFLGRRAQLDTLNDWAAPADAHPVLLFEAIGGTGKSMLTWEWINRHAPEQREDWAGRFWYSFYEKGAVMADFCQRALAYTTGQPLENFKKMKTAQLGELLLQQLQARPWLIVLDGLERVLVAYHRFDAAQLADEDVGLADIIGQRDPCAAIRPDDDDLLRRLSLAAPSKLLITSRLIPRVLLNPSSQPIPGVLRERLPGLRPADAEALFKACGVDGDGTAIQRYLQSHCDCHPLTIGALAGLVIHYLPDRGNFDAWLADAQHGGKLNLADLDLVQKRNHILRAALDDLSATSRQLLSTLALLSTAVDYPLLAALNPHLPPEPEAVQKPEKLEDDWRWEYMSDEAKQQAQQDYQAASLDYQHYQQTFKDRLQSPEFRAARHKLQDTVIDLEKRGLLQYDRQSKCHDLHPVVRGVAAGGLVQDEKQHYGQRLVDHFSQLAHDPWEQAKSLDDLAAGLHLVRSLLQMGRFQQAYEAYQGDLAHALEFNLEGHTEILSLLRSFFPQGWAVLPDSVEINEAGYLANNAAWSLQNTGELDRALEAYGLSLSAYLNQEHWNGSRAVLSNIADLLDSQNRRAKQQYCLELALDLAELLDDQEQLFRTRLLRFTQLVTIGCWAEAETLWWLLDAMGRNWSRNIYRPGNAEYCYAVLCFYQGELQEAQLVLAEQLAKNGKNRFTLRYLYSLRGEWLLEQNHWQAAATALSEAVRMAREVGQSNTVAETGLALAKFYLNPLADPRHEAEQLALAKQPAHRLLAELWLAIGEQALAQYHALAAYHWAWGDGEPFVFRYELDKTRALLGRLGVVIPQLPDYDADKDPKLPWEDQVVVAIEKLRAEKKPPLRGTE